MPMADEPQQVDHDEIERFSAQPLPAAHAGFVDVASVAEDQVEQLLAQAERAIASMGRSRSDVLSDVRPFELVVFTSAAPNAEDSEFDSTRDVELDLAIDFGRARMDIHDVLRLRKGSVVPLDKLAEEPVDIIVNGRLIAKGEVLVLNDNFCVRVVELATGNNGV